MSRWSFKMPKIRSIEAKDKDMTEYTLDRIIGLKIMRNIFLIMLLSFVVFEIITEILSNSKFKNTAYYTNITTQRFLKVWDFEQALKACSAVYVFFKIFGGLLFMSMLLWLRCFFIKRPAAKRTKWSVDVTEKHVSPGSAVSGLPIRRNVEGCSGVARAQGANRPRR